MLMSHVPQIRHPGVLSVTTVERVNCCDAAASSELNVRNIERLLSVATAGNNPPN